MGRTPKKPNAVPASTSAASAAASAALLSWQIAANADVQPDGHTLTAKRPRFLFDHAGALGGVLLEGCHRFDLLVRGGGSVRVGVAQPDAVLEPTPARPPVGYDGQVWCCRPVCLCAPSSVVVLVRREQVQFG